jgi:hypothetical protein
MGRLTGSEAGMDAGFYAINSIGNRVPGASGAIEVQMYGIAKDDTTEPYTVVNEYVCSRLGMAVGLPVPPATIAMDSNGKYMFVSMRFTAGLASLPPVNPAELVAGRPEVAAGIVAFDCWVGNWDRHAGNIAFVPGVSGVSVFDHGRTLLRTPSGAGIAEIGKWRTQPCLFRQSALLPHVNDHGLLTRWAERISLVTKELISDACGTAARLGACTLAEAQAAEEFLEYRKTGVMSYLSAERGMLPRVSGWEAQP